MAFTPKLTYKGRPLVRCKNDIYYGSLSDPYVIFMRSMGLLVVSVDSSVTWMRSATCTPFSSLLVSTCMKMTYGSDRLP